MSAAVAFVLVVLAVIGVGTLYRYTDQRRHLRFADEAGSSASTLALARFEARQLVTHPTWLLVTAFVTVVTSLLLLDDHGGSVEGTAPLAAFSLVGLAAAGLGLIVAAHRVGTRAIRHRTDELEASMPTAPSTRTLGLVVACLAPAPVMVGLLAVAIGVSRLSYDTMPGPTLSNLFPLVAVIALGVGGALVGVLTSRWLPFAVGPIVAIVAILALNAGPGSKHPQARWLRAVIEVDFGGRFDVRPVAAHLLLVLGLLALAACLALLSHGRRPATVVATAVAVAVIGGAGWVASRPPTDAQVASIVAELEQPRRHQHCERHSSVTYCVFEGAEGWIDRWTPAVEAVLAQVPEDARPTSPEVVQRPNVDPRQYLAEVRDALDPTVVWIADGRIHPGMSIERADVPDLAVAWQTAALAVGLPPSVDWDHPAGCLAGGQARVVLAHILAARATATTRLGWSMVVDETHSDSRYLASVPVDLEGDYDADSPQGEGAEVQPGDRIAADGQTPRTALAVAGASGWGTDVVAADALIRADRKRVDAVIEQHWAELVDRSTSTERFLELAGVTRPDPAPGPMTTSGPNACG